MNYVKDGEVDWTPVVKRRKETSAENEEHGSCGNLNLNDTQRSLVRYRKVDGILRIFI